MAMKSLRANLRRQTHLKLPFKSKVRPLTVYIIDCCFLKQSQSAIWYFGPQDRRWRQLIKDRVSTGLKLHFGQVKLLLEP